MDVNSVPLQHDQSANVTASSEHSHKVRIADALQQRLVNITPSYMKQPIQNGFNWSEAFTGIEPGEWYLVVFRSQHRAGADELTLNQYDHRAYDAARISPGFLHYFGGSPAEDRACLSFCLWENQGQAKLAAGHEAHQAAMQLATTVYESFQLERYLVRNNMDGVVQFVPLNAYSQTT
ncbi:MAG: hypothetical protein ACYDBJ_14045 [Aggregatilineales bacterium]